MTERIRTSREPPGPSSVRRLEFMRAEAASCYQTDAAAARRIAGEALILARESKDPLALGWAHRILAESMLFSGRFVEAEAAYAEAAEAWRKAKATALLGQLLVGRIHVLSLLGRASAVARATREARAHLEAAGDHAYLAKLSMNLGNLHFQQDRYGEALAEYELARARFARLHVRDETALGLEVNRAVALTQLDRDAEALALFDQLDRECGRRSFDLLQAQVRMNRAYVHFLRGDFDLALRDLTATTEYFRHTGHPAFLSTCLLNRAEVYSQLNLQQDASELAGEASVLFHREQMRYDQALALVQRTLARLAAGDAVTLRDVRQAQVLFEREGNSARVALCMLLRAELMRRRGQTESARVWLQRALAGFRHAGLIRWEATGVLLQGELTPGRRAYPARIALLRRTLARLPERVYPLQRHLLLDALGQALEAVGRPGEAERTYERAVSQFESMRVRVPTEDSKIAFLGGKTHLYDRLLRLELDRVRPRPRRLLDWMERERAQSLWDRMRQPSREPTNDTASAGLSEARRRISWLHARVSRLELGTEAERARVRDLRRDLRRAEEEWSRSLRARGESAASHGGPGGPPRLPPQSLSASLPDGWGYLGYHLGRGASLALAVTRSGVLWRELIPDLGERVAKLADRLDFQWGAAALSSARQTQTAPHSDRLLINSTDAILSELYTLLWRPLEEAGLPAGLNWIVAPHGAVHRIALSALRDRQGYLIERSDFAVVPSIATWRALRPFPAHGRRRSWLAGVASSILPGVEREIKSVSEHLQGWDVVTDSAPTRESFRRHGCRAHLIHLAAHGSLRQDNPSYSFVELSDGPLFVHDLTGFRLPGSVVVLTACSSGRGVSPAGDEWIGLARGFLQAGASAVMASLWPIEDTATEELINLFYRGFTQGLGPPSALGQAMREMLRRKPHPWQWACFAVMGGISVSSSMRSRSTLRELRPADGLSEASKLRAAS